MTHTHHRPPDPANIPLPADLASENAPPNAAGGKPSGATSAPPSAALPKGLRLLVVEQNAIVALDAEDMLLRNGAARVEVASNAAEALQRLDRATFDAALVDLELSDGDSLKVAGRLAALDIPFVFSAAFGEGTVAPSPFEDRLVLRKPCSETYLLSRLATLLSAAR